MNSLDSNPSQNSPPVRKRLIFQLLPIVLLLVLVLSIAVPSYIKGTWSWQKPITVQNLKQIRGIRKTGLTIPGWTIAEQAEIPIGGHKWSGQLMEQGDRKPIELFLLPQKDHKNQPQVDWMDIEGVERWKSDSYGKLAFPATTNSTVVGAVEARFFRAWNRRTYAVVQWYATPQGGYATPGQWFWQDQRAQLKGKRVPWVAVCLKIPIKPLGNLETAREDATSLAEAIQTSLLETVFLSPQS